MFPLKSEESKANLIIRITCAFWIFTKLFSYKVWHTDRLFPVIPPFEFLDNIPNSVHLALFFIALGGIALLGIFPKSKVILVATIAIELFSCLLDQSRWQPWEYQYLLTFLFFIFYHKNQKQFLNYFSFLIIATYFFSGLHKLNGGFLYTVWEKMILIRFCGFEANQIQNIVVHYAGLALPIFEILAALGLLFSKNKRTFALLLVGMHVFILIFLSPLGINYNSIVWPWNVVMILYLIILYYNHATIISLRNLLTGFNKISFTVIAIFPLLSFFGLYDNYLSFNLYSGKLSSFRICIDEEKMGNNLKPYISKNQFYCGSKASVSVDDWAMKEMNVALYPEERIYLEIQKKWNEKYPNSDAEYVIYHYPYKKENSKRLE